MATIPTSRRGNSRAESSARREVLEQLKEDHKRVKKAYNQFKKLDLEQDPEACEALVVQVLDELSVHAALEEELLYPAARDALDDPDLIDEAEVEHESLHWLIGQLREMSPEDEKYGARFTVLCEYVQHHVKEEEKEIFPQLEKLRLNWQDLAIAFEQRRAELSPEEEMDEEDAEAQEPEEGQDAEEEGEEEEEEKASANRQRTGKSGTPAARR